MALADAIALLANDPMLRARLSAGGAALAAQFSWEEIARRHEEVYGEVVERKEAPR